MSATHTRSLPKAPQLVGRSSPSAQNAASGHSRSRCCCFASAETVGDGQSAPQLARRTALLGSSLLLPLLSGRSAWSSTAEQPGRQLTPQQQAAWQQAFSRAATKPKAPILLRLAFHDAGTFSAAAGDGGSNASLQFELDRPENQGLKRGWNVILDIHKQLQGTPAEGLSKADLIALAAAQAVQMTGGPALPMRIGRQDATSADPRGRLPEETASAAELRQSFADKGLSVEEFVALSGAHTLGGKGFGDALTFDNTYFTSLLQQPWKSKDAMSQMIGLPSDHVLPEDPQCRPYIEQFAGNQDLFFAKFGSAFGKLTTAGAVWT